MCSKNCGAWFSKFVLLLLAGIFILSGSCAFFALFTQSVKFNETLEGQLDLKDDTFYDEGGNWEDYNISISAGTWYCDTYKAVLKSGKRYSFEVWTDRDVSVVLDIDELNQQLGPWNDSSDGYLRYEVPSTYTGTLNFQFYLRAEYVGDTSWYRFRINEE